MASDTPPFDLGQAHRWFAVECNNEAWDLVESPTRTENQVERMLHLAHAAWVHWKAAGNLLNELRAEKLLASAYCVARRAEPAIAHARRCRALSDEAGETQTPFDRAAAWGCLAKALELESGGNPSHTAAAEARATADRLANALADADERALLQKLFARTGDLK